MNCQLFTGRGHSPHNFQSLDCGADYYANTVSVRPTRLAPSTVVCHKNPPTSKAAPLTSVLAKMRRNN